LGGGHALAGRLRTAAWLGVGRRHCWRRRGRRCHGGLVGRIVLARWFASGPAPGYRLGTYCASGRGQLDRRNRPDGVCLILRRSPRPRVVLRCVLLSLALIASASPGWAHLASD